VSERDGAGLESLQRLAADAEAIYGDVAAAAERHQQEQGPAER
jgi:hypothetical protein